MTASSWVNKGDRILYSNTGSAIVAGDVVAVVSGNSGIIGVAQVAIAATSGTGQVEVTGRYTIPKTAGEAYTQGQLVYHNGTAITSGSTGNTRAGRAAVAAASADTTVDVLLNVV